MLPLISVQTRQVINYLCLLKLFVPSLMENFSAESLVLWSETNDALVDKVMLAAKHVNVALLSRCLTLTQLAIVHEVRDDCHSLRSHCFDKT